MAHLCLSGDVIEEPKLGTRDGDRPYVLLRVEAKYFPIPGKEPLLFPHNVFYYYDDYERLAQMVAIGMKVFVSGFALPRTEIDASGQRIDHHEITVKSITFSDDRLTDHEFGAPLPFDP